MKVLIASTPAPGHLNPLLSIARILSAAGNELACLSSEAARSRVAAARLIPFSLPETGVFDLGDRSTLMAERNLIPPGPARLRFSLEHIFIDRIPSHCEGLRQALERFPADVVIVEPMFLGILALLQKPRSERPAVIMCGISVLLWPRDDGAPFGLAIPPAITDEQRQEYARAGQEHDDACWRPVNRYLGDKLRSVGAAPLTLDIFEACVSLPDAFVQLSVPGFEFPRSTLPSQACFIGALPIAPGSAPVPAWAADLDGGRKIVLVTQGTVDNQDFDQLIGPALDALADQEDLLVVVTLGGAPLDRLRKPWPANARIASFLPFDWLLPKVDVVVTNGGYGTVNQALSFGIPLVTAGRSGDKGEVNVRVAWSGVGVDLKTDAPEPSMIREAVGTVLDGSAHRARAAALAEEFGSLDTRTLILDLIAHHGDRSASVAWSTVQGSA